MEPKEGLTGRPDNSGIIVDLGFRAILDLLPCYLSIQNRSLQILFTNENFRKDFGEGVGKLCHMAYKGTSEICKSCPVQKSFKDRKVHISEEDVQLSNGKTAQVVVYSAPILDVSGNVAAVIEMSTNITQVKEIQKELTFLGQSLAILSHDIKNILEGLQGGAYVVDEGIKDGDMALAGKGWDIVKRNIGEISTIAQNILYSSKKRDPKYQKVSPEEMVKDVVGLFFEKSMALGIQLKHRSNPALPVVNLDPTNIRRMLHNLVWNALEACKKDKEKQSHSVVVRSDFHDRFHFKFEVEDNGVGMDEDGQENIFKEFFSTKGSEGTGLGLLVVDKIVKEHDGWVEVLTAPGKGTTFRVILRMR
jgi:nitrogen-specific signal transduction histidine kinase